MPKVEVPALEGPLELNTASPNYNPWRLRLLLSPGELFDQEPRNERWAAPVERWVTARLTADAARLVPEIREVTFRCKSSTCKLTWSPSSREINEKMGILCSNLYSGAAHDRDSDRNEMTGIYFGGSVFKDVRVGDPESLTTFLATRRKRFLTNFTDPRRWQNSLFRPFLRLAPAEQWPKE